MTDESHVSTGVRGWCWAPKAGAFSYSWQDWRMTLGIVTAVFALKLIVGLAGFNAEGMAGNSYDELPSWSPFHFEVGHIAGNIASGRGFSIELPESPPIATAWVSPLYPIFLAGLFKVFGLYSVAAAKAMLGFNCLFQALTAGTLYLLGVRYSGIRTGLLAAAIFTLNPNGWQFLDWAWPSHIFALLLALHFFALLIPARGAFTAGAAAGGSFALALMADGAAITVAPITLTHLVVSRYRAGLAPAFAGALLCFTLVVAPWTIRNYQQFDTINPLRGNVGINLWVGNYPDANRESFHGLAQSPWNNRHEQKIFLQLGERDYDRECRARAIAVVRQNPIQFIDNSILRFTGFWVGEWWVRYSHIAWIYSIGLVLLTALAVIGTIRGRLLGSGILIAVFLLFGAPYYITVHGHGRYRVPIEPLMCLAAALPRERANASKETEQEE